MYKSEVTYKIKLDDIVIPNKFKKHPPKINKLASRIIYYLTNHEFEAPIVVNNKFVLVDGYTSYLIAKKVGMKHLDVYFVK